MGLRRSGATLGAVLVVPQDADGRMSGQPRPTKEQRSASGGPTPQPGEHAADQRAPRWGGGDGERLLLGFATLLRTFVRHGF